MATPFAYVPLVLALGLVAPVALAPISRRADLLVTRVAVAAFGSVVADRSARRDAQVARLRAARAGTPHRVYAARTLLVSVVVWIAAGVAAVYLVAGALGSVAPGAAAIRRPLPPRLSFLAALVGLPERSPAQLLGWLTLSTATIGTAAAVGTYWARWTVLDRRARARASRIEATLPRTVGFVYALSRSGMPFPKVLSILAHNRAVYGEAAREIGVAVREVETFGTDVSSSLGRMAEHTPSEGLEEFADNLASALASGRSLSAFLREQYERHQQEARSRQNRQLELLSTYAEIYVTGLVAGPLFLLTVLVVVGLVLRDTLPIVRVIGYLAVPLATGAFVRYLDGATSTRSIRQEPVARVAPAGGGSGTSIDARRVENRPVADGGAARPSLDATRTSERLAVYDRLRRVGRWIDDPFRTVLAEPRATFALTVPVGVLWVLVRTGPVPLGPEAVPIVDGPIAEATIFASAGYALVYELQKRRARAVEKHVPDFLDRLASLNGAGLTVVESLGRVGRGDLGLLGPEIDRTWSDVEWGADARIALRRLDERTRTVTVSQAVTLITNAMGASGNLAPVLRIAADEAQEHRRLRRERRGEMAAYLLVIYLSFLVFLGILAVLSVSFIPALESAIAGAGGVPGTSPGSAVPSDVFGGVEGVATDAYRTLFFHLVAVQGICSGLVAGQLGEGDVRAGVKHAAVMLSVAYVVFLIV